jgi:coenzyme F420-dependent glucose-6-phosphate dehydrogenase
MSDQQPARPIRLGWWLSSEEHDPRALVQHAVAAEAAGLSTAMISDHLRPWVEAQGQSPFVWTVIGAVAQATDALEVGTGVTAVVHRSSPIVVAQAAATAAVMLEERFFLGVGTGERLNEQPFGERWPRAGERRQALGEAIDLIRRLCAGDTVNHRGAFNVERLDLATLPSAPPPIYVASSGKRSAQLAGDVGDGMIGVEPQARLVDVFRGSGGTGKPCLAQLHVSLADSLDDARDTAWKWWPNGVVPPAVLSELATPTEFEQVANAVGPETIGDTVVLATGPEPIVAAVDRFVGAGYDTVYLHQVGPDQRRLLDLVESDLLAHYRRS